MNLERRIQTVLVLEHLFCRDLTQKISTDARHLHVAQTGEKTFL